MWACVRVSERMCVRMRMRMYVNTGMLTIPPFFVNMHANYVCCKPLLVFSIPDSLLSLTHARTHTTHMHALTKANSSSDFHANRRISVVW